MNECKFKITSSGSENLNLYIDAFFERISSNDRTEVCSELHAKAEYFYHYLYNKENAKQLVELMAEENYDNKLSNCVHILAILSRSTDNSKNKNVRYIYEPLYDIMIKNDDRNEKFRKKFQKILEESEKRKEKRMHP